MTDNGTRGERIHDLHEHFDPIDLAEWLVDAEDEAIRYRLAYHSARRRAARESVMATEAVEHLTADRDRWRQRYERLAADLDASRKTTHAPRLECVGEDEDGPVYRLAETS